MTCSACSAPPIFLASKVTLPAGTDVTSGTTLYSTSVTLTSLWALPTGSLLVSMAIGVSPAPGVAVASVALFLPPQAIAAASAAVPGAAHFDAFRDGDPVAEGKLVPSGSGIFHFTDAVQLRGATGEHTIVVVLSDNDHLRLKGAPSAEVTVNVQ